MSINNQEHIQNILYNTGLNLQLAINKLTEVHALIRDRFIGLGKQTEGETDHPLEFLYYLQKIRLYQMSLKHNIDLLTKLQGFLEATYYKTAKLSAFQKLAYWIIWFNKAGLAPTPGLQVLTNLLERVISNLEKESKEFFTFIAPIDLAMPSNKSKSWLIFSVAWENIINKKNDSLDLLASVKKLLLEVEVLSGETNNDLPEQDWEFISNQELKAILIRDYAELSLLLNRKAHKSILVLSGSILEATLVSMLSQHKADADTAYSNLYASKQKVIPAVEDWRLYQLIRVAGAIGKLDEDTVRQADILRDYRNLIHPVAEIRKGTALDDEIVLVEIALLKRILRLLSNSKPKTT